MATATKIAVPVNVPAWETPKETWEYVSVPEEDALGKTFPRVTLSGPHTEHAFEAGQTYHVPAQVAEYVKDRIKVFNRGCVRLIQSNLDTKAQLAVAQHGSASAAGVRSTPASPAELAGF
jgi:hypothetical protein